MKNRFGATDTVAILVAARDAHRKYVNQHSPLSSTGSWLRPAFDLTGASWDEPDYRGLCLEGALQYGLAQVTGRYYDQDQIQQTSVYRLLQEVLGEWDPRVQKINAALPPSSGPLLLHQWNDSVLYSIERRGTRQRVQELFAVTLARVEDQPPKRRWWHRFFQGPEPEPQESQKVPTRSDHVLVA